MKRYNRGDIIGVRYEVLDILGEGQTSVVYKVEDNQFKRVCALKSLHFANLNSQAHRDLLVHEVESVIDAPKHKNLLNIFHISMQNFSVFKQTFKPSVLIAMEYIPKDALGRVNLDDYVLADKDIDSGLITLWMSQVAMAMACLNQDRVFVHNDISLKNIFINTDGDARLGDFGFASVNGSSSPVAGSSKDNSGVGESCGATIASDVFCYGRCIKYLVRRFARDDKSQPMERARSIGNKCLKSNPAERWESFQQICEAWEGANYVS